MTVHNIEADPGSFEFHTEFTALLMIDMQRDFLEKGGFGDLLGYDVSVVHSTIEPCKQVLETARQAGLFILHTREGFRPDLSDAAPSKLGRNYNNIGIGASGPLGRVLVRGEAGHDIVPELYPLPGEPVIDKPGHGAFYATDLHLILGNRGVKSLIVCGVTTEVCVHSTVREAKDRGYECLILEDCIGSYSPEFQRVGLEMFKSQGGLLGKVSNSLEVIKVLGKL